MLDNFTACARNSIEAARPALPPPRDVVHVVIIRRRSEAQLQETERQTVWLNVFGTTNNGDKITSAVAVFGKTQTEEAAAAVKLGDVRVHRNLVQNRQDYLFQSHAGHTSGLADDLRAECICILGIVKGHQVAGGIIGDARARNSALPPGRALALKVESHLEKRS